MTASPTASTRAPVHPRDLGVGARFSVHPHCDRFVEVILGALAEAREAGLADSLVVETDEVSTYVGSVDDAPEERIVAYVSHVLAAAHRLSGGGHVVGHVLLSRGCPGEAACDLGAVRLPIVAPVRVEPTGVDAVAQWSLYPLLDGGSGGGSHGGDHMVPIEAAIAAARRRGTAVAPAHYATRLRGDVAEVLATATDAWAGVGAEVPHVVTHLTVSIGSPSATGVDTDGAAA
ncbi:hypothetical protein GCM10011376_13340 [Nocardioides flavus (ex Wang et al. 2016)]|uniref:Thiamin/hydroxymethyl pyrimidine-binding YkoF putative domain-containing protein n=1 Tax=Nocardioides flavus (ex Wang et al. 2016) TaxID=2058780 RepID=A0ABQ3HKU7_9ACTN|nr:YkoF family thiamine/hydroxymethylpyrimidine-binding protein [Nocardioides flavus (ex Wang et al. 2016)]GHE16724.1 hypothetical protein GCM10011376_13340 [Nocardioides flavus (ex Wang et al. 2016)]